MDYHVKRLKRDLPEEENKQIISTLERILANVIANPGNDKFYKIKHVRIYEYMIIDYFLIPIGKSTF